MNAEESFRTGSYCYLAAGAALTALPVAVIPTRQVTAQAEGIERVKEVAATIRDGVNTFL